MGMFSTVNIHSLSTQPRITIPLETFLFVIPKQAEGEVVSFAIFLNTIKIINELWF